MIALLITLLLAAQLRFAWLTDLHVGSAAALDDLQAAVADIRTQPELRFVLVTGDITESGNTADLLSARAALDSLDVPYYIIPGNHDTKWSESGTTAFPAIFGSERFAVRIDSFWLVGLHQGPRMRMADGHFAPEDLRWLDSVLCGPRTEQKPVLVATHYPLDPGISNWFEATDRLHTVDTRMVFVGHGHANRVEEYEGLQGAMGRSLLRGKKDRGGYNIVTIESGRIEIAERENGGPTGAPWYSSTLRGPARAKREELHRPDFSVNDQYPFVREVWRYNTGSTIIAGGALLDSLFVAGDYGGTVHGLRLADGTRRWSTRTRGHIVAAPCAAGGEQMDPRLRAGTKDPVPDAGQKLETAKPTRVIVTSTDSSIYCLDARTGVALWEQDVGAPVLGSPAAAQGVAYVGSADGVMRAIEVEDGEVQWTTAGMKGFVEARPAVGEDLVYVGAWDETLYAFRKDDGRIAWRWAGGRPGKLHSPAACWPAIAHGKVFIVAPDRMMTSLDLKSGKPIWRSGIHQVRESIGSTQNGALVYVRTMRDSLVAIDPAADRPVDVWAVNAAFGYDINAAMPVERGGTLFYGTMQGLLLTVDASRGTLLWKYRVGHTPLNTVAPLDGNRVVCTDFDGNVVLVEAQPQ